MCSVQCACAACWWRAAQCTSKGVAHGCFCRGLVLPSYFCGRQTALQRSPCREAPQKSPRREAPAERPPQMKSCREAPTEEPLQKGPCRKAPAVALGPLLILWRADRPAKKALAGKPLQKSPAESRIGFLTISERCHLIERVPRKESSLSLSFARRTLLVAGATYFDEVYAESKGALFVTLLGHLLIVKMRMTCFTHFFGH